ncbi:MAG: hypothetical protein ABFC89_11360 [Methanospirillum sp.]
MDGGGGRAVIGGPCYRCVHACRVPSIGGQWCRYRNGPATGNGCSWWRERDCAEGRTC